MAIKGFLKKVGRGLKRIPGAFLAAGKAVLGESLMDLLISASKAMLKSELGKIVDAAVKAVESLPIGGDGKRAEAFKRAAETAGQAGISFSVFFINLLIELAVFRLKQAGEEAGG